MKIINNAARLITFKFKNDSYRLMPAGDAVEVPDKAKDESQFLQALIKSGDIGIVSGDEDSGDGENGAIDDLRAEAAELGVAVDNRWGEARLKEEIEKALEE